MTTFLHKIARETPTAVVSAPHTETSKETLVEIVLDVVAKADWSQPGVDGRLGRSKTARGEVLLATLTYCYAWGIYSSGKIEATVYGKRQNFDLLDRMPLERRAFAQFRRYNRDLIKVCLTQVLGRIETGGPERGGWIAEYAAGEAERRIQKAVESDFLETD
jgi:hypothetical protein